MEAFKLKILGCGSALPTTQHWPTSQVLLLRGKVYVVDCGEGCQKLLRDARVNFSRIVAIFISHLHGDHVFGLPGLLSTLALLGRKGALQLYGPEGIAAYVSDIKKRFLPHCPYAIEVTELQQCVAPGDRPVYEDRSLEVVAFSLKHSVPTLGYRFTEKNVPLHLDKSMADFYQVPISAYKEILQGSSYTTSEGEVIENSKLTRRGTPPRSYAFCSDTAYTSAIVPHVQGVSLLYHEATYREQDRLSAEVYRHSTAQDAARIALQANAKQLLLGHFSSRYEQEMPLLQEAQEIFPAVLLAYEGLEIDIQ